jgi:hypothetical protein
LLRKKDIKVLVICCASTQPRVGAQRDSLCSRSHLRGGTRYLTMSAHVIQISLAIDGKEFLYRLSDGHSTHYEDRRKKMGTTVTWADVSHHQPCYTCLTDLSRGREEPDYAESLALSCIVKRGTVSWAVALSRTPRNYITNVQYPYQISRGSRLSLHPTGQAVDPCSSTYAKESV